MQNEKTGKSKKNKNKERQDSEHFIMLRCSLNSTSLSITTHTLFIFSEHFYLSLNIFSGFKQHLVTEHEEFTCESIASDTWRKVGKKNKIKKNINKKDEEEVYETSTLCSFHTPGFLYYNIKHDRVYLFYLFCSV